MATSATEGSLFAEGLLEAIRDLTKAAIDRTICHEREECALLVDSFRDGVLIDDIVAAIRARK